jgi:hypothetical protein
VIGLTVTVLRGGGLDRFGDPQPDTTHEVANCLLAPAGSSESFDSPNTVVTGYVLYGPPNTDLLATDRLTLPDEPGVWHVQGEVGRWRNPAGGLVGVQCRIEKGTG